MKKATKKILSLLLVFMLAFTTGFSAFAQTDAMTSSEAVETIETVESIEANEVIEANDVDIEANDVDTAYPENEAAHVLAFTSDIHNKSNNKAVSRLSTWLDNTQKNKGKFEFFGSCGDTADASASENNYWRYAQKAVDVIQAEQNLNYVFIPGNHENYNGKITKTSNAVAKAFTITGEVDVADDANYKVYAFGATQSDQKFTNDAIKALDSYLASVDRKTPVFVLSHFPLHSISGRTSTNADAVIEVLNKYPNVIFLWGHNHTYAATTENHYDRVYTGKLDGQTINFTYAAAGCMSDSEYSTGSGSVAGKGLVVNVSKENGENGAPTVSMVYCDANGQAVSEEYQIDITGGVPVPWHLAGDVNNDGQINASDALMTLQFSVGLITLTDEEKLAADLTGDGLINAGDALKMLRIAVGLE